MSILRGFIALKSSLERAVCDTAMQIFALVGTIGAVCR